MRFSRVLLGLVPLLGLAELGLHQYFARRASDFADYRALAPELLKWKQPGVPVVVSPRWAEPLVRQAAPDAFPIAELARPDDSAFSVFLEVSLLGARAAELAALPVRDQRKVGPFTLLLRDNPRFEAARFDFVTAVDTAEVEVFDQHQGERRACPVVTRRPSAGGLHGPAARAAKRFECAGGRAVTVTLIEDQAYRPHRCVLVDPAARGSIVLHFSSVPNSKRLVGFSGFPYFLSRDLTNARMELTITEGGRQLVQQRAVPNRGWSRFVVERPAPGGGVEIALAPLDQQPSDFCFALEAR